MIFMTEKTLRPIYVRSIRKKLTGEEELQGDGEAEQTRMYVHR